MNTPEETPKTISEYRFIGNLRSFIFGVEDSLVSTVGLLSGVAASGAIMKSIVLAGVVLIFVEAFSMGAGSLLSENIAEEFSVGKETSMFASLVPSIVMFFSYLFAGFIPLFPYIFFRISIAFWLSILFSLIALFVLGMVSVRLSHDGTAGHMTKHGIRMLIVGGVSIALGVIVGMFVNNIV